MNVQQIVTEVGRLHLENLGLKAEIEALREALRSKEGAPQVTLSVPDEVPATDTLSE